MSSIAALTLLFIAQQGPASQPAAVGPTGSARDVEASMTFMLEVNEGDLSTQESWSLRPMGGKIVPASELSIAPPSGARLLRADERSAGFKADEAGGAVLGTEPLTGERDVSFAYMLSRTGDALTVSRTVPFALQGARIIVQDFPGLSVTTNVPSERRTRDLNGVNFVIHEIGAVPMGAKLEVQLNGFPSHTLWPRRLAVGVAMGILGWMLLALTLRPRSSAGDESELLEGPLSARARRDRIVKAIEILERERAAGTISAKKYERRMQSLMKDLADVLEEHERTQRSVTGDGAVRSTEG